MESLVNYPILADSEFMRRFDITMTYERSATVWCPYFGLSIADALRQLPKPKTEQAPIAYFRSSPIDRSGRGHYAFELMRRVKVDSYGAILRTRALPDGDGGIETRRATLSKYKFTLAFENSIAPDYVTEKFFDPLVAGSVPIYLGAPNVSEFAPGKRCFINVADFRGPEELAAYVNSVALNDDAYAEHFAWKSDRLSSGFRALLNEVRELAFSRLCSAIR